MKKECKTCVNKMNDKRTNPCRECLRGGVNHYEKLKTKKPRAKKTKESAKRGRPRLYYKTGELEKDLNAYMDYLSETGKPPTIAGLAYYTGIDRQTIYNYSKRDDFFDTLKPFRDFVLMNYEEFAINESGGGIVFLLKNYGYTDKQEVESKSVVVYRNDASDLSEEELEKQLAELERKEKELESKDAQEK